MRLTADVWRAGGLTVGLIGFGRMGKAYTIRAHAFGMNVQFYDPYRPQGEDKSMGVTQCETLVRALAAPIALFSCAVCAPGNGVPMC